MTAPSPPKALVFDMDGLLLDTERIALAVFLRACEEHDVTPDMTAYYRCIGTPGKNSRRILAEAHGPDFPVDAIMDTWRVHYHRVTHHEPVPVKEGALDILHLARQLSLPCALATSTRTPTASKKLELSGLRDFFTVTITGDLVSNGKPAPEPYLMATNALGIDPQEAWAMEDSANGVRSAITAGLRVFQIPDLVPPDEELRALGHTIADSLHDVRRLLERAHARYGSES